MLSRIRMIQLRLWVQIPKIPLRLHRQLRLWVQIPKIQLHL
jgi:hypothetical protein